LVAIVVLVNMEKDDEESTQRPRAVNSVQQTCKIEHKKCLVQHPVVLFPPRMSKRR
jgi:hypothetical protein